MAKLKKQVINGVAPVTMGECVYLNDGKTIEEKLKSYGGSSGGSSATIDWSNIKWAVIGDSLTDSTINADKKYHQIIKEKTGIQVQELGKGGTGYTAGYNLNNAFIDRISSISSDTDIVTLFGSVNDWKNNAHNILCKEIGTANDIYDDSKTVIENTFCANLNKTFDKLNEVCPNAQVIVFGAIPYFGVNQERFKDVRDALKSVCETRHIPYVDMFDSTGFYKIMNVEEYATTYTTDFNGNNYNTQTSFGHPSNLAHKKIIAPKFFEELKKWIIN